MWDFRRVQFTQQTSSHGRFCREIAGLVGIQDGGWAGGKFENGWCCRDLEDDLLPVYKSEKHTAIINSMDGVAGVSAGCGAPEIVTGSRDGR